MNGNKRSHDQKRKAALAKRAKKESRDLDPLPYSGKKYRADSWVPHVYQTESAIYEAIKLSGRRLTNEQVRLALTALIEHLRGGQPALLAEDAPKVTFASGAEVEFLVWNIRRHWYLLDEQEGPVSSDDLVGILRTLLYSIEAHAWHTGRNRGYVAFIEGFLDRL